MKTGVVSLIYRDGEVVISTRQYLSGWHRAGIIESWRIRYGRQYNRCFIHFLPNVNDFAVNDRDGRNMRYKKVKPTKKRGIKYRAIIK